VAVVTLAIGALAAQAADVTTVRITDQALVTDTIRLGINTCGDNYWDSAIVKTRVAENFEGVRYRMITWGPVQDENGLATWFSPPKEAFEAMKGKVRYRILGGPAKGATGVIKDFATKKIRDGRTLTYIVFDKTVPASGGSKNGLLLEFERLDQGCIGETSNTAFWNAAQNAACIGDVPPGSFGKAALWLKGAEKKAHYTFVPIWANQIDPDGTWRVQFWAKAKAGKPTLRLNLRAARIPEMQPDAQWRKHDLHVELSNWPARDNSIAMRFEAADGDVLLDDIVIWKEEQHRNPTPFRDTMVDVIRKLRPGILRYLQMGGSDLETNLRPRLEQVAWSRDFRDLLRGARNKARRYRFNLHDYYLLCEHVGAAPWYCLPGTLHPEEIPRLMEYLGAPADVGWGKLRAQLGHPEPWTEVFDTIYIEFGNEAWNPGGYATGSFNGPDHWRDQIAAGKASPHYKPCVVFVAGSQAASPWLTRRIMEDVPNADRYAIAPYLMNQTPKTTLAPLDTDDKLFRWVHAYTLRRVLEPGGNVFKQYENVKGTDKELASYEHHFHITLPQEKDGGAPVARRNHIIASLGGGVNILNDALLMMREKKIRAQCLFNLNQKQFYEGIKLWGFCPGLSLTDQRYRPVFLATEIANKVIGGDLVATEHTGAKPTFGATGLFEDTRRKGTVTTYENIPTLWSYAFKDGTRRGLILVSLDTHAKHPVALQFAGKVKDGAATAWWLTADDIGANNEYETGTPQVKIVEETINNFASGRTIELPPHSMLALKWEEEQ
jgi:hypothetical protein